MKTKKTPYYKIVFTFLTLSLIILRANGQEIVEKKNGGEKQASYLFASAGVSIPQENGLPNVNASSGPQITLGYNIFFAKRWGMGLVVSGSVYKSEAVNEYSMSSGNNYFSSSPTQNWQKTESYISFSYTPILQKRWVIDIVQGFGFFHIKKPAYDYSYYGSYYKEPSKTSWNTGYNIGLIGRVILKNNVGLFVKGNFFYNTGIIKNNSAVSAFNSVDCELGIVVNLKK
jgi:hypothetical protein